jgi:hypothetical protein
MRQIFCLLLGGVALQRLHLLQGLTLGRIYTIVDSRSLLYRWPLCGGYIVLFLGCIQIYLDIILIVFNQVIILKTLCNQVQEGHLVYTFVTCP